MTKKTSNRVSPEVRERAVRMVQEHGSDHASQWAAIGSIAAKIGCTTETLRQWVRQAERDGGQRPSITVVFFVSGGRAVRRPDELCAKLTTR